MSGSHPKAPGFAGGYLLVSSSDLSAILQWRTVVGQIEDLQDRLNLDNGLYSNLALYQPPQTLHPSVVERGKFSAPVSLTDLSTLVQMIPTLASAFAVNEAATSSQGSVPDEPLMATVAANLKSANKTTFVPSDYTPNLMAGADLGDGVLSLQLGKLEEARETCEENIEKVVRQFGEALSAVRAGGKEDKQDAAKYLADSLAAKAFVASCTADIQAIDLFEGTLFSGQTPAAQANAPPNGGGNANTGAPAPAAQAAQVGGLGSGGQSVQMTSWNAPGTTLQSILSADLLMRKVLGSPKSIPKVIQSNKLYILAVHVLESGGEEFTSSNIFTGTKVRFGGGLAAAFAVYHLDGTIACAGVAVAYRGDVSSGDVEKMMKSAPAISDMPLSSYSVCADVQK